MNKGFTILAMILLVGGVFACGIALASYSAPFSDAIDIAKQNAHTNLLEAQASVSEANAKETEADAQLTQARADEKLAHAAEIEAEGQKQSLILAAEGSRDTTETANDLIKFWGITMPIAPPMYQLLGSLVSAPAWIAVGWFLHTLHRKNRNGKSQEPQENDDSPELAIRG